MTISSQIPGACKTGSSERIQKYNVAHQEVHHRSIVWNLVFLRFLPALNRAVKKYKEP